MEANIKFETSDVNDKQRSKKSETEDDQVLVDSVDLNDTGFALF